MSTLLDIRLKRVNKIYHEGVILCSNCFHSFHEFVINNLLLNLQDDLTGVIVIDCKSESKYESIILSVDGTVNMQLSSKNVGIFEAFYNSVKVILMFFK